MGKSLAGPEMGQGKIPMVKPNPNMAILTFGTSTFQIQSIWVYRLNMMDLVL